ncbi:MAG: response regulator, partial [Caedimonadaceae bacterium]
MTFRTQVSLLTAPQKNSNARVKIFYSMVRSYYTDAAPKVDYYRRHMIEYTDQVKKDLNIICEAFEQFIDLVQVLRERIELGGMSDNDWSKFRHDLRGYLASVKGFSELIIEEYESMPNTLKLHLQMMLDGADNLLPVIAEMGSTSTLYETDLEVEETVEVALNNTLSGNILVVDDDEKKIETISRRLKQKGYSFFAAMSGADAFEMLKSKKIDLILLDILMPGMSGRDVLSRLKKAKETQDIPVLIISNVSDLASVTACIREGADDYLQFPFNLDLFYTRINACLDKKRLKDLEKTHYE